MGSEAEASSDHYTEEPSGLQAATVGPRKGRPVEAAAERGGRATGAEAARPPRADALRNRARLIEAATAAFAEHGADTSLEDVAQRAGVGIGTLYRHFPSRDALVEAVYRSAVESLCDAADDLLATETPETALGEWMQRFVGYVAAKRGMTTALRALLDANASLFDDCRVRLRDAAGRLLEAAARSGHIRGDVDPGDLLRAMGGICLAADASRQVEQSRPLVDLLLDGLRYGAAKV